MKKSIKMSALFGLVALMMLLVAGSAGAQDEEEVTQPDPEGTATRINFELTDDVAKEGLYVVQEAGGSIVATWYALDGWQDSGWLNHLDLTRESVWVNVLYYPGPDTEPTTLTILNHAPDETYGWLSRGTAHALEVAWPEAEPTPTPM